MQRSTLFIALLVLLIAFSCGKDDETGGGSASQTSVTISQLTKFEGDENSIFEFKVRLNQSSSEIITVDYETKDLAARAGEDYVAKSGTVTFDGTTEEIIGIEIIADTLKEGDEDFQITLFNSNATIETSIVTGIIRNDDDFLPISNDGYVSADSYLGMSLIWQDEFDGPELDLNSWNYDIGTGCPDLCAWGNDEAQYYTDRSENIYVQDGKLVIEARDEAFSGSDYTSARINTKGKREYGLGRIDIRAKLPEGQGLWPALWMLGSNIGSVSWPACGEIDIMELLGHEPEKIHGTAHWGPPHVFKGGDKSLSSGKFSDEFHVFSIVWEANSIKWLLDDVQYYALNNSQVNGPYPFNAPFYFIFNIAVGGNWGGYPDASTVFPQRMFVDYVRVFQ